MRFELLEPNCWLLEPNPCSKRQCSCGKAVVATHSRVLMPGLSLNLSQAVFWRLCGPLCGPARAPLRGDARRGARHGSGRGGARRLQRAEPAAAATGRLPVCCRARQPSVQVSSLQAASCQQETAKPCLLLLRLFVAAESPRAAPCSCPLAGFSSSQAETCCLWASAAAGGRAWRGWQHTSPGWRFSRWGLLL